MFHADTLPPRLAAETATGLTFLWLELTGRCNLECAHCYADSGPSRPLHDRMAHADWLGVIERAADLGCRSLQMIGGEPLLYPRLDELVRAARSHGFEWIEIFTNGTPVTRARAQFFQCFGVSIACSVYSADASVHDRITRKSGSFDRTVSALKMLADEQVPVRVGFIEMDTNEGEYESTRAMLADLGIARVGHDRIRGIGRGAAPTPSPSSASPFSGLCGQCWQGRLCITNSGEAFPCIMARAFPLGNVLEAGLDAVVSGVALGQFRSEMSSMQERVATCVPNDQTSGEGCVPTNNPCMVCGPGSCSPDYNPCVPDVPTCGPAGPH